MRWLGWSVALLCGACWGQPPPEKNRWAIPETVEAYARLDTVYAFLRVDSSKLFLAGHLRPVWEQLRANTRKVRVLHIGDSHVQGEVQGREIRRRLYAIWGEGGRGFVFPYAIAHTSSAYDYVSLGQGQWLSARSAHFQPALPLSVTGMAIGTYDPQAEWQIRWAPAYTPVTRGQATLTLLTRTLRPGIQVQLQVDSLAAVVRELPLGLSRTDFPIENLSSLLRGGFRWNGEDSLAYGELHGIFIEEGLQGITWYSMGVNGARLSDWATLPLLKESLRLLAPDLVVIDLGTNDLYAAEASLGVFRQALEAAIDTIRAALPGAAILVTTPQDFYRRMRPIPIVAQASPLIKWVAAQKRVAVWDAYTALGSMRDWRLAGLALPDMVHLTPAGYALKGQMLARAFLRAYAGFLRDSLADPTVEALPISALPESLFRPAPRPIPVTPSITQFGGHSSSAAAYVPPRPAYIYHTVRPGETLSEIAQRYRTSVRAIQQANRLRGTFLRAGQTLRIPTGGGAGGSSAPTSSGRTHIVQPGESLWSIAQKYGVSLEALCRANGLTLRSAIHPGQRLRLP